MGTDVATLLEQASLDLEGGQFKRALQKYRLAIELDPRNARARQGLAESLSRLRRDGEAMAACQEALELDPKLAVPHAVLGSIYGRQNRYEAAKQEFNEALGRDPGLAEAYVSLGVVQSRAGQEQEAETSLKRAIELDRHFSLAYYNLSLVYGSQRNFAQAVEMARTAFMLKPSLRAGLVLGFLYMNKHWKMVRLVSLLSFIGSLTSRSLLTMPFAVPIIALYLPSTWVAILKRDRSRAILYLSAVFFLAGVYLCNLLFGPFISLPFSSP